MTMITDTDHSAHLDLPVPEVGVLTTAEVLKSFDRLRRQISSALTGTEGFSIGYDDQEYCGSTLARLAPGTEVSVSAHVFDRLPGRHLVEYVATVAIPDRIDRAPEVRRVARCRGWTSTGGTARTGTESATRHEDGATPR